MFRNKPWYYNPLSSNEWNDIPPYPLQVGIPRSHGCWNPQNWRWGNLKILVSFGTPFSTLALSPWYYLGRYGNPDKNAIENNIYKSPEKDKSNVVAWCSCCWYPLDFRSTCYSFSFLGCLSSSYSSSCTSTPRPCWVCYSSTFYFNPKTLFTWDVDFLFTLLEIRHSKVALWTNG
jgi:hypothetical protein